MDGDFKGLGPDGSISFARSCFAVIGLGVIGGSLVKALRSLGAGKIIGLDRDEATLRAAKEQGLLDEALSVPGPALKEADVVILAIYPEAVRAFIEKNAVCFKKDVLLTDVTGIKGTLPYDIQAVLPAGMEFIAGHPMAGREAKGLAMSSEKIFHGANYIIVPTEKNSQRAVKWLNAFARALGCKHTVEIDPEEHDGIIAYVSQLTHVTAVALMDSPSYNENTRYFIAGSFRDGTRVADINPELWCDLFLSNREKLAAEVETYIGQLQAWHKALTAGDGEAMKAMMRLAGERRRGLNSDKV